MDVGNPTNNLADTATPDLWHSDMTDHL